MNCTLSIKTSYTYPTSISSPTMLLLVRAIEIICKPFSSRAEAVSVLGGALLLEVTADSVVPAGPGLNALPDDDPSRLHRTSGLHTTTTCHPSRARNAFP